MKKIWYAHTKFGDEEKAAVAEALNSNWLTAGPKAKEFEEKVAALTGHAHGIMVNSGSSANLLALAVLKLPKGATVFTPALTFATTIAPILQLGLTPRLMDVELERYVISADKFLETVKRHRRAGESRTAAAILPHLLGNLWPLDEIREICDKYGIWLVSDSCDTLGAKWLSEPIGRWVHFTTTSFYASHIITAMGGGGMVMTDDAEAAERIRRMRDWGRGIDDSEDVERRYAPQVGGVPYDAKFVYAEIGWNFKPLDPMAAFGLVQLGRLEEFMATRRRNFDAFRRYFAERKQFIPPIENERATVNWLAYPILISAPQQLDRLELAKWLELHGIQTRPIMSGNIAKQPAFRPALQHFGTVFPTAEYVMHHGLLVGCHQSMSEEDVLRVTQTVDGLLAGKGLY